MPKNVTSPITDRVDHPILAGLFVLAIIFAVGGVAVEQFVGNGVAAAFLIVYAIFAVVMGSVGYAVLLGRKLVSQFERRVDRSL